MAEKDFTEIGGSPVSGLTLRHVLSGHTSSITRVAWSPNKYGHTILPILVDGGSDSAFSPQLQKLVYVNFIQSAFYFRQLFDMIWRMYNLPFDNPLLEELQDSMTPREP